MNLPRATRIERGDGLHNEPARKQERGFERHIDALPDQRMRLAGRISDLKRPLRVADSDAGAQRAHG